MFCLLGSIIPKYKSTDEKTTVFFGTNLRNKAFSDDKIQLNAGNAWFDYESLDTFIFDYSSYKHNK